MWSRALHRTDDAGSSRRKILLWAAIISLIFGIIEFGEPLEDFLRTGRNALRSHDASGDIVVIAIDDRSIEKLDKWPWPRRYYAQLVDELRALGAKRIAFDLDFPTYSDPADDRLLEAALARSRGKVVLPVRFVHDPVSRQRTDIFPAPAFRKHVELANINVKYNYQSIAWEFPYALGIGGKGYPSLSAYLAGVSGHNGQMFPIDYSIRPDSFPVVSAIDLLRGRVSREAIAGKDVVIGVTSIQLSDKYYIPGRSQASRVYLHVLGAETLKQGRPIKLGWLFPLVVILGLMAVYLFAGRRLISRLALAGGIFMILIMPFASESRLIFFDGVPALALLLIVVTMRTWSLFRQSYRARGTTNAVSGLPNLNALREEVHDSNAPLVATRIHNFAEITAALPQETERALVEQITARLAVGAGASRIYQGDAGVFVWFAGDEAAATVGDQLEALHALCRAPVVVADTHVDLVVTFGVDVGSDRSVTNRIGSALVAADEAVAEGRRWKEFDAAKLKDAAWKLSLLGRLDVAIDTGEIWIAYQPKLDLATKRVVGAEALARWSHPEKGEIGPMEFIPAAEQHNRIEKLTTHVLENAVMTSAAINAHGIDFDVAVNLSARLLDSFDLVDTIDTLLSKHRLAAERLTLEVTESTTMIGNDRSIEVLERLRALGVNISIDDYGTGFSTLEYLKKIPATEIKIDRSFVRMIDRSQSDRLMVNSTIQLAHSLGRTVVAEGVETPEILQALEAMGCDEAQGYLIGRPMRLGDLIEKIFEKRGYVAA